MEKPNLDFINKLARGEESVKKELIDVIKKEFPEDKKAYFLSIENKKLKNIIDNVHRIKHKFSILGLEKGYEKAVSFENNLRNNVFSKEEQEEFDTILSTISKFLKTI